MMRSQHGFTLLEVLVAIALASLLLTSIYGVFSTSSMAKERVEKQASAYHLARVLTSRFDRELTGLVLNNPVDGAILAGGTNSRGESYLEMLTTSSGGPFPGMRQVSYRLGADQESQATLWRTERAVNTQASGAEERLSQGIDKLTFRFFDGNAWRDDWDSLTEGRPVLVGVEFTLADMAADAPLTSVFVIPQSGGENASQ